MANFHAFKIWRIINFMFNFQQKLVTDFPLSAMEKLFLLPSQG